MPIDMLDRAERILDNVFDIETNVYLVQNDPQIVHLCICDYDEFEVGWRLVKMELVMGCPIRNKAVFFPA